MCIRDRLLPPRALCLRLAAMRQVQRCISAFTTLIWATARSAGEHPRRRGEVVSWLAAVECRPSGIPAIYSEGVMAAKKKWSDRSKRSRSLIVGTGVVEVVLLVATLIDLSLIHI